MNPMQTFDPDVACRVHDGLNDKVLDWQPEWADSYRRISSKGEASIDGRLI